MTHSSLFCGCYGLIVAMAILLIQNLKEIKLQKHFCGNIKACEIAILCVFQMSLM